MQRLPLSIFLLLALLTPAVSHAAKKYRDIDVLVNPIVTFLGEQRTPADPELNPIRYQILARGFESFDLHVHGIVPPERDALLQHLAIHLRRIGYLPADAQHPPQVAIGVMWGSIFYLENINIRDKRDEIRRPQYNAEYKADRNPNKNDLIPAQAALEFIARPALSMKWRPTPDAWVNPTKMWPDAPVAVRDRTARICGSGTFVLSVGAFDWDNLTKGREVLLWQTRGMVPARKIEPEEALHRAIEVMGPYLASSGAYPNRIKAKKADAPRALNFGFEPGAELPAPVDLTTLIAHDFGGERPTDTTHPDE